MSVRNFGSLFMVASCAGAALGCYLVSLRVASERAQLEDVETKIVLAERDMRTVQTEIGTRARLSQLERWNVKVLALSAPQADQFVKGSFELARLAQPQHKVEFDGPVVLASAPAPERKQPPIGQADTDDAGVPAAAPRALLHVASLKTGTREVPSEPAITVPLKSAGSKSTAQPVTAAKPAQKKAVDKPGLAAAHPPKAVDKPAVAAAKPVTKPVHMAKVDPLAPLPGKHSTKIVSKPSKDAHTGR
jgi:hypothetical protein